MRKKESDGKSVNSGSVSGSRSPYNHRSVGSNPDMRLGIGEMRQWMYQELQNNPDIKATDLQKRVKGGILIKNNDSNDWDNEHKGFLNLDLSEIHHEPEARKVRKTKKSRTNSSSNQSDFNKMKMKPHKT